MKLYIIEPEVGGGIGESTVFTSKTLPNGVKEISQLEYEFQGWLGDELLESTPCFIITSELVSSIENAQLTGYKIEGVKVTISDFFKELYPNKTLPEFKRLVPKGTVDINNGKYMDRTEEDFCLSQKLELVVSDNALRVLKKHQLNYCDIYEVEEE